MKGAWGEKAAREWLEKQGWRTVQANFRSRFGEIDLIAENERFLVFFEVKTRKNARFASACESVTPAKQARLLAAAINEKQPAPDKAVFAHGAVLKQNTPEVRLALRIKRIRL